MLKCNDAITSNVDGSMQITQVYERVYLEYTAGDAVESFQKRGKQKDGSVQILTFNGAPWTGTCPVKNSLSKASVQDLFNEAVVYAASLGRVDSTDQPKDANLVLLEAASAQLDLSARNALVQEAKGSDPAKALESVAKSIFDARKKAGRPITIEAARIKAAAMLAEDDAA